MNNYEYSRFLYTMFYKNCGAVENWNVVTNEFIENIDILLKEFFDYKNATNSQMIALFQKTSVAGEFEKIKELKKQWLVFVKRFGRLASRFENKYHFLLDKKDAKFDLEDELKTFLAEYVAYEKMSTAYETLLNLDMQLENYQKLCQFYKYQLQPT